MANPNRRGQAGSQVRTGMQSSAYTPFSQTSFVLPHGLQLQQTIQSSGSVTIPAGITWVYVVMTGGGAGNFFGYGGGAGEVSWGWTLSNSTCIVGAGGTGSSDGGYTRYGHIIAKGGTATTTTARANYYGIPGGAGFGDNANTAGQMGSNGGRAGSPSSNGATGFNGGDGISGGGASQGSATTGTSTGGNGGSGLAGGGGGTGAVTTNTRTGGNGGNGINILTGAVTTGGTGSTGTNTNGAGGGGAGIAGNGSNASGTNGGNGGSGGGGAGAGGTSTGGAGILYIFY